MQTKKQYREYAFAVIVSLSSQYGVDPLQLTDEQAWSVLMQHVEVDLMSLVRYNYSFYGEDFQHNFSVLWSAFQRTLARSRRFV